MSARISIDKEQIAEFCRKHHIRKLAFFGSVLRDDFGPESDVDVLVEFEPGASVGLITMAGMEIELSAQFGRKVDLRTANDLSHYFRDAVVAEAEAQYAAAPRQCLERGADTLRHGLGAGMQGTVEGAAMDPGMPGIAAPRGLLQDQCPDGVV